MEAAAIPLNVPGGTPLLTAEGVSDGVTLVSQGVVRVFHALSEGCQFTVKLLRAPNAFGMIEVILGRPWVASVEALTPVEGFHIPARVIHEALEEDSRFSRAMLDDLAGKFESTIRASRALGFDECEQRLIRVLLDYAEHFGRPREDGVVIRYPLPRQRLALEIGAARRSVDRALAALTKEGLLSLSPKGWQVLHSLETLRDRLRPGS